MPKRLSTGFTFVLDFEAKCHCGNVATHLVESHAVDDCIDREPTWAALVCNACLTKVYYLVAEMVTKAEACETCGLTFDSQSAIIVSLIPIVPGGGHA